MVTTNEVEMQSCAICEEGVSLLDPSMKTPIKIPEDHDELALQGGK